MNAPLLQIKEFWVRFTAGGETTEAVRNLSLNINKGELQALVGESGSGKSATALSILRLLPEEVVGYEGSIVFSDNGQEHDLLTLKRQTLQQIRGNRIAMIFQEPMTALNPVMTCGKQVMEALQQHKRISRAEARKATIEWFRKVKLPNPEQMIDRYPHQLSGGQKQRVVIAMAMCCKPSLLICDEPTTALDVTVQRSILELIRELQLEEQMTVLFITHDLGVVSEIADRVAILYKGELVEENTTQEIFQHPKHPYTKALLACRPVNYSKRQRLPMVADFLEEKVTSATATHNSDERNSDSETIISIKDLTVRFPSKANLFGRPRSWYTAVKNVSLEVYKGETLGLVGESGCGKTTLGRTMLGLVAPSEGEVIINNKDISRLSLKGLRQIRKEVQLIFQDPYSSLNPRLSIGDAIEEPMLVDNHFAKQTRKARVKDLLDKVGLPEGYSKRYPHQFSGGQRQRIVVARALAVNPGILVCDESVSALDVSVQAQVLNLLNDLKRDLNLTLIFISHDLSVVRYMSDRIAVMQAGKIVELGEAEQVYNNPQSEYTQALLSAIPGSVK